MSHTIILRNISTHELRDGDIVLTHGMRVRITGPGFAYWPRESAVSESHPVTDDSPTLWWKGEILNPSEVFAFPGVLASWVKLDRSFTIQGNGRARWDVERTVADESSVTLTVRAAPVIVRVKLRRSVPGAGAPDMVVRDHVLSPVDAESSAACVRKLGPDWSVELLSTVDMSAPQRAEHAELCSSDTCPVCH